MTESLMFRQAKYEDIKKVVKAAAEGPMKGFLQYTDHQVNSWLPSLNRITLYENYICSYFGAITLIHDSAWYLILKRVKAL